MSDSELHLSSSVSNGPVEILPHKFLCLDSLIDPKRADQMLEKARTKVAEIDCAFLELLRQRMDLSAEIGRIKAATGQAIFVSEAHERVLARARANAKICGVSEEVMESIYEAVMHGSIERQQRVINELFARTATGSET